MAYAWAQSHKFYLGRPSSGGEINRLVSDGVEGDVRGKCVFGLKLFMVQYLYSVQGTRWMKNKAKDGLNSFAVGETIPHMTTTGALRAGNTAWPTNPP